MKVTRLVVAITALALASCGGGGGGGGGGDAPPAGSTISGTITFTGAPIGGVTVTLGGASTATTTTAPDGTYSFAGLGDAGYVVTPSLTGYVFNPVNATLASLPSSSTGNDFVASPETHTISGTILEGGSPLAGVTVDLDGSATATTTTAADGTYSFTGLVNGSYTLTPSLGAYTFEPAERTVCTTGLVGFTHTESGNGTLGTVTVVSILWSSQDVSAFFEVPAPGDGIGTIRARHSSELGGPSALYDDMWNTGGPVLVTFNSTGFGTDTIELTLGAFPFFSASSDQFLPSGTLTDDSPGNDFTGTP